MSSANEWKSIDVNSFFPESDDEIKAIVKCSTWSADSSRIICAARNAVFVSDFCEWCCEMSWHCHSIFFDLVPVTALFSFYNFFLKSDSHQSHKLKKMVIGKNLICTLMHKLNVN